MKFRYRPQQPRARKVHHRRVLIQVVLDWGAGEEDAARHVNCAQRREGLRSLLSVAQSVRLVTYQKVGLGSCGDWRESAQGLVGRHQDGPAVEGALRARLRPSPPFLVGIRCVHPATFCQRGLRTDTPKPLVELRSPRPHQRCWAHQQHPLRGRHPARSLLQHGPHQRDRLQGLAESHIIRQEAPRVRASVGFQTVQDAIHPPDALTLVRTQLARDVRIDDHGNTRASVSR